MKSRSGAIAAAGAPRAILACAGACCVLSLYRFGAFWSPLVFSAAVAFVALLIASRRRTTAPLPVLLACLAIVPAVATFLIGHFYVSHHAVLLAALLGWVASAGVRGWSLPRSLSIAASMWGLCVGFAALIVILREADFTVQTLLGFRVRNGAGPAVLIVQWCALMAATTLTGLLWVNWLVTCFAGRLGKFESRVLLPLAVGWVLTSLVGAYQFLADSSFLSPGFWAQLHRMTGASHDANAFGALGALMGPATAAAVLRSPTSPVRLAVAAAAVFLGWFDVWISGSRSALLILVFGTIGIVTLGLQLLRGTRALVIATAVVVAAAALVPALRDSGPAARLAGLKAEFRESPSAALASLWSRIGYGDAAAQMIREHPLVGVGVGAFHTLVPAYGLEIGHHGLPPDNAQNWFRHQLAELGILGSLGWMLWVGSLAAFVWQALVRRVEVREWLVPVLLLMGVCVSSLVAMPGQDVAVAIVIWTLVGWVLLATRESTAQQAPASVRLTVWLIVVAFAIGTVVLARTELRVPFRAARFNFDYSYGFDRGVDRIWTAARAVTVPIATDNWLRLTCWVEHPDADANRVQVDIWRDRERIVSRKLSRAVPVTEYIPVTKGKRFVFEVQVDRTFHDDTGAERGLAMKWDFVPKRP